VAVAGNNRRDLFLAEKGKRCGECINREGLKKTGAPVYMSRARRLSKACDEIRSVLGEEEVSEDYGEIEGLKEEMENWRDGMQGTNLESSSKYEDLEAACENLDSGLDSLGSAVSSYNEKFLAWKDRETEIGKEPTDEEEEELRELESEMEEAQSEVESALDELEGTEFPGMY
jgi:chromosome segregation ATPase